jgi:hypothetical protein
VTPSYTSQKFTSTFVHTEFVWKSHIQKFKKILSVYCTFLFVLPNKYKVGFILSLTFSSKKFFWSKREANPGLIYLPFWNQVLIIYVYKIIRNHFNNYLKVSHFTFLHLLGISWITINYFITIVCLHLLCLKKRQNQII